MRWFPSPNFDERALPITMLVVHYTDMPSAKEALAHLCNPAAKVSAHYLIDTDGTTYQLVEEEHRAWHAGVASWRGEQDINSASIGIELQHEGHAEDGTIAPYPPEQMKAFVELARDIITRHKIEPHNIVGHSDIAPTRKRDPGESFDWEYLAEQGISNWHSLEK